MRWKMGVQSCVFSWQISLQLPIPKRAGAFTLNGSHALGDGQIQLKVWVPLTLREAYRLIPYLAWSISLETTSKVVADKIEVGWESDKPCSIIGSVSLLFCFLFIKTQSYFLESSVSGQFQTNIGSCTAMDSGAVSRNVFSHIFMFNGLAFN